MNDASVDQVNRVRGSRVNRGGDGRFVNQNTAQIELKMGQREQNKVWAGSLSFTNDESVNKRGS